MEYHSETSPLLSLLTLQLGGLIVKQLDDQSLLNLALTSTWMFKYCSKTPPKQRGARLRSNFLAIPGRDAATAQGSFLPAMVVVESVNVPDIPSGDSGASNENPPAGKSESDSESEEDKVYGALLEVTDEEVANVVHNNPQPETAASLPGLPTELTVMVYKNLDVIDAVCLGLSSPRHYSIYRDLFGTGVKLNTRRIGQAGTVERSWEVVGKDLCGHCGSYRCQLYRHIDGWMGSSFEYCLVSKTYQKKPD